MEKNHSNYAAYVNALKKELIPATGCTEPIAISLAAAKAHELLGCFPDQIDVKSSGNIIKNVKSVVVPNTGGLKGIQAAAAVGIVAGVADRLLEVISEVTPEQIQKTRELLEQNIITVGVTPSELVFDIVVTLSSGTHYAKVRIANEHTNFVLLEKDGEVLLDKPAATAAAEEDNLFFTVASILDFADSVDLEDVREIIQRQIDYNTAIAIEGLTNSWGACVGRVILHNNDANDIWVRARAKAAAGSDARMSGCEMPVIINSGSGNQGITASVPVIEFAESIHAPHDKLIRALVLSNLLAIHQKSRIGRLSAYCGVVSAGCASGAAISYLQGGSAEEIAHVLVNSLAIASGIICDGAKPSCAAKIATAVEAGMMGYWMAKDRQQFMAGDGIVKKGVENMITSVGQLGKEGMRETDKEILKIMLTEG